MPRGTVVNAIPSPPIIGNIFFNKAPLHDGAMIIRDGMVYAAAAVDRAPIFPKLNGEADKHRQVTRRQNQEKDGEELFHSAFFLPNAEELRQNAQKKDDQKQRNTAPGGLNTVKNDDGGILDISGGTFINTAQSAVMNWNKTTISRYWPSDAVVWV